MKSRLTTSSALGIPQPLTDLVRERKCPMKSHSKGVYLVSSKFKDVPLVEFMYLVFTHMLGLCCSVCVMSLAC